MKHKWIYMLVCATLALSVALVAAPQPALAATYYSCNNSNANVTTSWKTNTGCTGSSPGDFTSGDTFILQSGHTMPAGANWTISGAGARLEVYGTLDTITRNLAINDGTLYIANGATVKLHDVSGTGSMDMTGGLLQIDHDYKPTTPANFIASGGTVQFTGSAGGGGFGTAGTYQFHNITVDSGVDPNFDDKNNTIALTGDWTNNGGTSTMLTGANTTTVLFNGTGAQTIGGSASTTFRNVTVNKASGTVTLAINQTLDSGNLTVTAGTLDLSVYTMNRSASGGTLSVASGATLKLGASSGGQAGSNFPTNYGTVTLNANSTVEYSGTGGTHGNQTIFATPTYGHLATSGSGTKTLGGTTTAAGNVTIGSGTTLDVSTSNFALDVAGNWTNNGTFTQRSGTVTFNGTTAQTIGGSTSTTFYNLTINNTSTTGVTLGQNQTVNNQLAFNASGTRQLRLDNYEMTLGSSALAVTNVGTTRFIVTDVDGTQTGRLCKLGVTTSGFTFPIGDARGTAEYSPASFTPATASGLNICFRVVDAKNPNVPSQVTTDYLTRYWVANHTGGTFTNATGSFTFINDASDVVGTVTNMSAKKWNGSYPWAESSALTTTPFTYSGISSLSEFTAFKGGVLAVTLASFEAEQVSDYVRVSWETASELDNRGFNLYRGTSPDFADPGRIQLNEFLIPSQGQGSPGGFAYTWDDHANLVAGTSYYYWLEDLDVSGVTTLHGPVSVDFTGPTAVTLGSVSASPGAASTPWLWAATVAGAALVVSRLRRRG